MAKITVIPSKINPQTRIDESIGKKRRVAGYARVSTDQDEQFSSFTAQVDYYTKYIESNPLWEMVEVYTDEGISGTNTKRREGFQRMIKDALEGKIDLIVTKSISRFARNTVDSLTTIRELKEHNVEVYFEKENIYTFDSKGELLITIMSSIAQEESRSISENVTWGKRKSFADGKVWWSYKQFLGYRKGADGNPEIVPEEAEVVKNIYNWFVYEGLNTREIADRLNASGVRTPKSKSNFTSSGVANILKNEKYKGDALLQKTFTESFLTHKLVKNVGQVPQYYVENNHPPIIDRDTWELAQILLSQRKINGNNGVGNIFYGKVKCGICGHTMGPQVFHSNNEKYRCTRFVCNAKKEARIRKAQKNKCTSKSIREEFIIEGYLECFKHWFAKKDKILKRYEELLEISKEGSEVKKNIAKLESEKTNVIIARQDYISITKVQVIPSEQIKETLVKFDKQINEIDERLSEQRFFLMDEESELQRYKVASLILSKMDKAPTEFDKAIFKFVINSVIVEADRNLHFEFVDKTQEDFKIIRKNTRK